jgi:hypothetical protein
MICYEVKEGAGIQDEKVLLWFKTITEDVVSKFLYLYAGTWFHKKQRGSLCVF